MGARDFLDTTDSPSDKVAIPPLTGSFSAGARYGASQPRRTIATIPHTETYELLPDGVWSTDQTNWYPFGVTPPNTSGATPSFQTTEVDVYADETNVYVVCSNYTASSATIYYAVEIYAEE